MCKHNQQEKLTETVKKALPPAFIERLAAMLPPADYQACLLTFATEHQVSFRINPLLGDLASVLTELHQADIEPEMTDWFPLAGVIDPDKRAQLQQTNAYKSGAVYLQNLSSMIPPIILNPQPGETVLDLTAAPGSKTLQLSAMMQLEGELVAVELVRNRYYKMKDNLQQHGAGDFVRTFNRNGETVWRHRPEAFDRVLLDAPCSTEGRFHLSDPKTWHYWSPKKVKEMTGRQKRLFHGAVHTLKPGGTLVYSTCSFSPEENEGVLQRQLKKFGDAITIEPLGFDIPQAVLPLKKWKNKTFDDQISAGRRILPNNIMEGFFVCKIKKHRSTL